MTSTVTVVIACDSHARSIPGCLDSVLSQAGVVVEVLLLDDRSNDWTSAVVAAAARMDARVSVPGGSAGGLPNIGDALTSASGSHTVLLGVDDRLAPGALARAAGVFARHPEVGLVYGASLPFDSDDDLPPARIRPVKPLLWRGLAWIAERCKTASMGVAAPGIVVRTSLQRELGTGTPLQPDKALDEDLARCLRLAARADVAFLRGAHQMYVRGGRDADRPGCRSPIADLRLRKRSFDALFAVDGPAIVGADGLYAMVNRALAREALSAAAGSDGCGIDLEQTHELEAFAHKAYTDAGEPWDRRALPLRTPQRPVSRCRG